MKNIKNQNKANAGSSLSQDAMDLVVHVQNFTNEFPEKEEFGLITEMRRTAISISSNIEEGFNREVKNESNGFFRNSLSMLFELQTQLGIAYRSRYLSSDDYSNIINLINKMESTLCALVEGKEVKG